ncbi:MAG: ROK family protein [Acidimicrobiia bacterium]
MVAGIDIGGSGTKACLVADGRILARATLPTDLTTSDAVGNLAITALSKALAEAGYELDRVTSIGVGIPGQVSEGHVRYAANLGIGEAGFDLGGYVSSATQVPTLVENDMSVAAYGAYTLTVARDRSVCNLVYVGIGTGVSAGVVLDGDVYRGSRGLAGEFGHVPMGTGIECACGSVGCLETIIGATGLNNAWEGDRAGSLFDSAAGGDAHAVERVESAIAYLARAMWWLAATYDPDLFYIGGGVGAGNPAIRALLATRWKEMAGESDLARRVLDPDRVRMYDLEEPVGAYGAALLAAARPDRSGKRHQKRSGRRNQSHE